MSGKDPIYIPNDIADKLRDAFKRLGEKMEKVDIDINFIFINIINDKIEKGG